MKHQYPKGTTWEAKMKGILYKIVLKECHPFGPMFYIYITKEDGSQLGGYWWENYDQLQTLRAATKFCRNRDYFNLRFRRRPLLDTDDVENFL